MLTLLVLTLQVRWPCEAVGASSSSNSLRGLGRRWYTKSVPGMAILTNRLPAVSGSCDLFTAAQQEAQAQQGVAQAQWECE